MATDFRALLSKPVDDVKRPPSLPAGTYHGVITDYKFEESKEKKTPYVAYGVQLNSPGADIDSEDMVGIDLSKRKMSRNFFLTEDAEYRLKEFIESCGIDTSGRSFGELIPEVVNQQVIVTVTQRLNTQDPEAPAYNDIAKIAGDEG